MGKVNNNTTGRVAYALFGDAAVRHAMTEAILPNGDDKEDTSSVLADAIRFLESGAPGLPVLPTGTAIGPWAMGWHRNGKHAAASSCFQKLFQTHIASLAACPAATLDPEPTEDALRALREGVHLLRSACPYLLASLMCLPVVRVVSLIEARDPSEVARSITSHAVAATVFVGPGSLLSVHRAADSLLHETLHCLLAVMCITRSVYRRGFDNADDVPGPRVSAVWNAESDWNSPRWTTDRALNALHVYTHLTVFQGLLTSQPPDRDQEYDTLTAQSASQAGFDRTNVQREFGDDGKACKAFVRWLTDSLAMVPLSPGDPRQYPERGWD